MRKARFFLACVFWLCGCVIAQAQQVKPLDMSRQSNLAASEREVREFYDSYGEDLRQHRREAIANRYDPRGVFFLGNGRKILRSFEVVKNQYLTKWKGPKSFDWKDLSVEILASDAAVVLGRFDWQTAAGETLSFSYTGVLIKHPGGWRIRVEDESNQPSKPPSQ
jgi:hypothetical protein